MKFSGGKALATAAVVAGAVLASVVPGMADVSTQSPSDAAVTIESVRLKDSGAAVDVQMTYACPAGAMAFINVYVTQVVGDRLAKGHIFHHDPGCTGGLKTTTATVKAKDVAVPFQQGVAFGQAFLSDMASTFGADDEREVHICA